MLFIFAVAQSKGSCQERKATWQLLGTSTLSRVSFSEPKKKIMICIVSTYLPVYMQSGAPILARVVRYLGS